MKEFERNKAERYAEQYWKKNGFDFEVKRKYNSKCKYIIKKDGLEFPYEVPCVVEDCRAYMRFFEEQFKMRKQIKALMEKQKA